MIIESDSDLKYVQESLERGDSFWIPMYSDVYKHYTNNDLSFVYIYSIADDQDYLIPLRHMDCLCLQRERIQELASPHSIFVLAKKRFMHFYSKTCYDADLMAWWRTLKMLPYDDVNTAAHDTWNKWWHAEPNTNDWLPVTKHYERCITMRKLFMEQYNTFTLTEEFKRYDSYIIDNFYAVEQSGLRVDYTKFTEHFKTNGLKDSMAKTEYNPYTSTGRPSNKFGGVNYAALNKEDGCRTAFVSRFERGMLLEFDYDAYHVRLIAELIGYNLPDGSVHEYFGRQYFGKDELSDEEYAQSKQITFRLLYGGIDSDFAKVPFFGKVQSYVGSLWRGFKQNGYITTPYFKRQMPGEHMWEMNPNKLFNYLLQATETEHNLLVVNDVNELLQEYNSKLILYTYDSLLFDFDLSDGKDVMQRIKSTMTRNGKYPIKVKAGTNYHVMQDMTSKLC